MKFRIKTSLFFIILLSLGFAVGGTLFMYTSFNSTLENKKVSALNYYQMIINNISYASEINGLNTYDDIINTLKYVDEHSNSEISGIHLVSSQSVIYHSGVVPFTNNNTAQRDITAGDCLIRIGSIVNSYYLQLSGILKLNGRTLYLDVAYDISEIYRLSETQVSIYRRILIVIILVGAVISWLVSRFLTKPLEKLSNASKSIAGGNLSTRAVIHSGDEFEQLADNFNDMANKLEENIEELKDAMQRQEKFMGSFAHELKTPMTSIIGYADLLRGRTLSDEEKQEAYNYIFSEGRRLESLSFKLLDLIVLKKDDFELKPASPSAMILKTLNAMENKFTSKNIKLETECENGICLLEPDLVQSLVINLTDNAIKAVDINGIIKVTEKMTDRGCLIQIEDNGRGIPEKEIGKITEAFYRVDKSRSRAQGGVGLGLALCSEIVRLHNGSIDIKSTLGKGSCITVELNGGRIYEEI